MIRKEIETEIEVRNNMRNGQGTVKIKHYFHSDEFGANIRLCGKIIIPPGASIGKHEHDSEDEIFFIIRGAGIFDDGVTKTSISSGDSILIPRNALHAVINDGNDDLEILAIIVVYP